MTLTDFYMQHFGPRKYVGRLKYWI